MITIPGQLAIKTIHGRNGDNVGRLATSIGEFVVKNAELDQYAEGKYEAISPSPRFARPRTPPTAAWSSKSAPSWADDLSNIDALSRDDARRLSPQEVDPIDERRPPHRRQRPPPRRPAGRRCARDPLVDTTPFGSEPAAASAEASADADDGGDAALFGALWPLGDVVSSMPPWIGVCCVSSATASVISATSSHRCPRTGTSPGSDSHRRLARHSTTTGVPPRWGGSGLFSQGDRHATCIPLRSSLPGVALKSPAVG